MVRRMHLPWLVLALVGIVTVLAPAAGRSAPARETQPAAHVEAHDTTSNGNTTALWYQDADGSANDNVVTITAGQTVQFSYPLGNGKLSHSVAFTPSGSRECNVALDRRETLVRARLGRRRMA